MQIAIKSCLDGARAAEGIAVVIDVFRASNTIIACLAGGAEYIIPVGALEDAFQLKQQYPEHLLLGERGGLPPKGFDYGNSPAIASQLNLKGKKIILTTSAGSQGIVNSTQADTVLIGSFANAGALTAHLKQENPEKVTLVPIGLEAREPAAEDEACAQYLKACLNDQSIDLERIKAELLKCDGADRLRRLGQEDDLKFCLQVDTHNILPVFDFNHGYITAY